MKAPEKIYLEAIYPDNGVLPNGLNYTPSSTDIEYAQTNAFIEKACEWLRTHSEDDYFELIPDANYCGAGTLNKKRMIDEFRNYMKGE